jgi:hypothetical protein
MSDATSTDSAWDRRRWLILAAVGVGLVIAPAINTGTFGVAPQDAGVASA